MTRLSPTLNCWIFLTVFSLSAPASGESSQKHPPNLQPEVIQFLLSTAAGEFRAPTTAQPAAFRKVRIGYFSDATPGRYVLCGMALSQKEAQWVHFATIRTSPYEQWLGGVAESVCQSKKVSWYPGDFSSDLLKRVRD